MTTALVTTENVSNVLDELVETFFDIPFENSTFQNKAFVIASQQTPARAARAIGLKMYSKIEAVKEYMFQQERTKIDIEEKEWMIEHGDINEFEKRRLRLDILKIKDGEAWSRKLINDALTELNFLYGELKKLPKYTREQFEAEEDKHFELRLNRSLQIGGPMESLVNMREDLPKFEKLYLPK